MWNKTCLPAPGLASCPVLSLRCLASLGPPFSTPGGTASCYLVSLSHPDRGRGIPKGDGGKPNSLSDTTGTLRGGGWVQIIGPVHGGPAPASSPA